MRLFKLIDAEKANYSISLLCRVLKVSRSGYYDWKDRPLSKRAQENAILTEKIREVHDRSRQIYGYPRVHAELRALGVRCSRKRVARLMRKAGLRGCMRGRKKRTTRRDPQATPAVDLVNRNFSAAAPNKIWTADITYISTQEGFLYLAFILDVYSRRIVGWSMASHLRTELVVDALEMALWRRKPSAGLIHHSDQGVQGGFNRSKQHPRVMEVWNGTTEGLEFDDDGPETDAFAGTSGREPRCSAVVLDQDRRGPHQRGRRGRLWCVAGCRHAVVPREWGYATNQSHGVWAVFIVR